MFNSTQTNEEQPDIFYKQTLWMHFSLMITEVSEYEFINVFIVAAVNFSLLGPGVLSIYCLLRVINV